LGQELIFGLEELPERKVLFAREFRVLKPPEIWQYADLWIWPRT
jgi:hypothetical protein